MPYIIPTGREVYDTATTILIDDMQSQGAFPGDLTYILYRLCLGYVADGKESPSYSNYAEVVGCLECCKLELYRRQIAAHEDEAIRKNGDVV